MKNQKFYEEHVSILLKVLKKRAILGVLVIILYKIIELPFKLLATGLGFFIAMVIVETRLSIEMIERCKLPFIAHNYAKKRFPELFSEIEPKA